MTRVEHFLKLGVVVVPFVILLAAILSYTLRGHALVAAATSSGPLGCSYSQIMADSERAIKLVETRQRLWSEFKQVGQEGKFQLWSTSAGTFWYAWKPINLDALVLAEDDADIYETSRIRTGDVVVDCGANIGTFTRRALKRGAGKVIALEINPDSREAIRRTFRDEIAQGRVVVYDSGVWDSDTELELTADSVVVERPGEKKKVRVRPIDTIVKDLGIEKVNFIKMDIEGAEKPALRGAAATLATHPELAIAAEHLVDDLEAIPALIQNLTGDAYQPRPSACSFSSPYRARPQIMLFSPRKPR